MKIFYPRFNAIILFLNIGYRNNPADRQIRQTDRLTDRQKGRGKNRQTPREREKSRNKETDRDIEREREKLGEMYSVCFCGFVVYSRVRFLASQTGFFF